MQRNYYFGKIQKNSLTFLSKFASTQALGSEYFDRIRNFQNSKYESALLKIINRFIDGHCSVNGDLQALQKRISCLQIKIKNFGSFCTEMFFKLDAKISESFA